MDFLNTIDMNHIALIEHLSNINVSLNKDPEDLVDIWNPPMGYFVQNDKDQKVLRKRAFMQSVVIPQKCPIQP